MQIILASLSVLTLFSTAFAKLLPSKEYFSSEVQQSARNSPIPGGSAILKCDVDDEQLLDIHTIKLFPNPPQRGKNLTILASGELHQELLGGAYVDVEVRLGYVRLLYQTYDLCEQLEEHEVEDLKCPIKPGTYNLKKEVAIPEEVPPGKYIFITRTYTNDDQLVSCLTGEVFFPPGQFGLL